MKKIILLFGMMLFSSFLQAADEIEVFYTTGQDVYCRIMQKFTRQYYDTVDAAYDAAFAVWADSCIDMVEDGDDPGTYLCSMPTSSVGLYVVKFYSGAKATATSSDTFLGSYDLEWYNSVVSLASMYSYISTVVYADIVEDTEGLQISVDNIPTSSEFEARTLTSSSYATASSLSTLQTSVDSVPTNAEFEARSLLAASYATAASVSALNDISVDDIMNYTGFTAGGTWTLEKAFKVITAWTAGNWQLKSGTTDTQELLDPDDGETVILEQKLKTTTPYRTITVK